MNESAKPQEDVRFHPTEGLCYNPNEPLYWDKDALTKEIHRSFELCHSCRMCFKYCQSFPTLFSAVDRWQDTRLLPGSVVDAVVDQCFQCKLCYTQCPYTEKEGHAFKLDFPRLLMRAKAVRRRAEGIPLRERMLADPDRLGRLASLVAPLANWGNTLRANRWLMEKLAGIHRDKLLPRFEWRTFARWFRRQTGGAVETSAGDNPVVLFATCFVNYNRASLGEAAFRVLTHNSCRVAMPDVECCGMPALDSGDIDLARAKARRNVLALLPYVEKGYKVAVINPTCSLVIRQEYAELLNDPRDPRIAEAARKVAGATRDISEYLWELRADGKLKEDFRTKPDGPVAYHAPCHMRIQNIGFRGRDLLRRIPGVQVRLVAECCGHDGTWAMKRENYGLAMKNGEKAFSGMREAGSGCWSTDCPLAAVQFKQACGVDALHPLEILDRAYRADGFGTKVAEGVSEVSR